MKVCLICLECINEFGGAGIANLNLGKALAKNGINVDFVVLSRQKSQTYSIQKNMQIHEIYYPPKMNVYTAIKYLYGIYKTISFIKPDIIQSSGIVAHMLSYINYLRHKTPYCNCIHNDPYIYRDHLIERFDFKYAKYLSYLKNTSELISVSHEISDKILSVYDRKPVVIENGANIDLFKPKQGINLPINQNYKIISVSRLVPGKGFEDAIVAMNEIVKIYPNTELLLIGDGELRSSLEKQVDQLHLNENVTFVGFVPNDMTIDYYHQAHVYLLPSWNEGFPIVLFEAMGCGLPIVSTRVGSVPSIISEKNGVLVSIKSPHEIASALVDIFSLSKDEYKNMAEMNIKLAEKHDWKNVAKQYEDVYRKILLQV